MKPANDTRPEGVSSPATWQATPSCPPIDARLRPFVEALAAMLATPATAHPQPATTRRAA